MATRILIVEDEVLVAKDIRRFLQGLGHEVVGMAVTGEEAIEKAMDLRPDLILMDIRLKGEMDGITAVERIRETLDLPVVYLTAQWDKSTRERAKSTGAYGYVLKPWVERELEIGIDMALAIHAKERQVTESEERVRRIVENALDAVVTIDSKGTVIDWNPQAEKTFGWSREEVLGETLADLIVPAHSRADHIRGLSNFRTSGQSRILNKRIELTALHRDGSEFPVELAVTTVRSGDERFFSAFIRDITERRRARERIEANEFKYRTLVETTNTGYLVKDEQGRVIEANAEYVRLSGHLTLGDIRGRSVLEWTAERDRQRNAEEIRHCLEQAATRKYEIDYVDDQGRMTPVEVNATLLPTSEGPRIISLCRDITDRKRRERELEEYAAAVSHDLQKPLGGVMRRVQVLERRLRDELDIKNLEDLRTAIHGSKLMGQMLKELEYNEQLGRVLAKPVDSDRVLASVLEVLAPEIESSRAELTVEPLPEVLAHEGELLVVFQNLLVNAIKYRSERPLQVHIGARRQSEQEWRFWVRDNGIGIPPNKSAEVFEIWKRLLQKDDIEGRGIGLANCKKIIERRGGRIWVESEPNVGSTFHFTLPAADEPLAAL